jgi:hypothetical protein
MRAWSVLACWAAAAGFAGAAHATPLPPSFAGVWQTSPNSFERMTLAQTGARVKGVYTFRDGRVAGKARGRRFEGYWAQSQSDARCRSRRMGARYWGRILIRESPDGRTFNGAWGYCGLRPTNAFTGERIRGDDR